MVIVSSDQDNVACSADGVSIFESTTQVPAAQKNYLFFNSDMTGTPNQVGNHYYPNTYGYKDTAAIDNRDFLRDLQAFGGGRNLRDAGNNCSVFLGNGSASQLSVGGLGPMAQPVAPMTYYSRSDDIAGDSRLRTVAAGQKDDMFPPAAQFFLSCRRFSNSERVNLCLTP
jgi:hypothetical protein